MISPIESLAHRTVGVIEFVSPNELRAILSVDSPNGLALNSGVPRFFPRINGYLIVPNDIGSIVCIISWIGIESYPFVGMHKTNPDIINIPFAKVAIKLKPIGTLKNLRGKREEIERGISSFPSVGDPVLVPTKEQQLLLVNGTNNHRSVIIGHAPILGNAEVKIDPNRLFGRHLAVLGNTGSGKSSTIAGLLRWSLEAAKNSLNSKGMSHLIPNARFILLDVNGEYANCFKDIDGCPECSVLSLNSREAEAVALLAPHWTWLVDEWMSLLRSGQGFQGPLLRSALSLLKDGRNFEENFKSDIVVKHVVLIHDYISNVINGGPLNYVKFPHNSNLHKALSSQNDWLKGQSDAFEAPDGVGNLENVIASIDIALDNSINKQGYVQPFDIIDLENILECIKAFLGEYTSILSQSEGSPNRPKPFSINKLISTLELLSFFHTGDSSQYLKTLIMRIQRFKEDRDIACAVDADGKASLLDILFNIFGKQNGEEGLTNVTVMNLNFVPRDVVHIVTSVIGRIIFESLQWHREINNKDVLPTILVLEEAHVFVSDYSRHDDSDSQTICRRVFERIAREGRKFGLGLVISSQRPSEISPTILSQCNTFILHRIVNDRDQQLVRKLVPDNLGDLLDELPSLPTQHAFVLGSAVSMPLLVKMRTLKDTFRPSSSDPDFWNVWTREIEANANWEEVSEKWQK